MMESYENDRLVIPEKYLKMSASELAQEKARLLEEAKALAAAQPPKRKTPVKGITIRF